LGEFELTIIEDLLERFDIHRIFAAESGTRDDILRDTAPKTP
jgi:hypothetical protein